MTEQDVIVVVRFRLPDGREFDCHSTIAAEHAEGHDFWWTDGNGSCDCNRSLYLNREHGLDLGEDDDDDVPCLPCGNTIHLVSLRIGEKTLVAEAPPP